MNTGHLDVFFWSGQELMNGSVTHNIAPQNKVTQCLQTDTGAAVSAALLWVEWNNTFVFNCMHTFSQPTHHFWWIRLFAERLWWFINDITESYVCLMCCIVLQCVYCAYRYTVVHFSQGRLQKHREKTSVIMGLSQQLYSSLLPSVSFFFFYPFKLKFSNWNLCTV